MLRPAGFHEARDVSASSRDSLRRQLGRRRMSLTVQEQSFLDNLVVHGNEIEVQLAFERLQDEDLFFEYQTPKHIKNPHDAGFDETKVDSNSSGGDDTREATSVLLTTASGRPTLERSNSQLGSQRRLSVLEQRKACPRQSQLWKAHKTGLAVTNSGSRQSLVRRSSSIGSLSTLGSMRRPPSDIFRPDNSQAQKTTSSATTEGQLRQASNVYRRSQSLLLSPLIPKPARFGRRLSSSSRKSVTFHEKTDGTPKPRPKTIKPMRKLSKDLIPLPLTERQESSSSIPSLHHGQPIRSDSLSSIPSLHHGVPIRSNSISSIPSLHHGTPLRSDSIGSVPSIHHGTAIRSDSIGSVPSLHQGRPIRQDSLASIPSIHHAHPIRSDSITSFASLHHGQPLSDSTINIHEWLNSTDATIQDAKAVLLQQYAASDDIATAWLNQQKPQEIDSAVTTQADEVPQAAPQPTPKPVLMRMASANLDKGEGVEVSEWDGLPMANSVSSGVRPDYPSMISLDTSIRTSNSFDTMQSYRHPEIFRGVHRSLSDDDMEDIFLGQTGKSHPCHSLSIELVGPNSNVACLPTATQLLRYESSNATNGKSVAVEEPDDDTSWDMNSVEDGKRFDSWNVLKDEYVNGYGGGGTLDFLILGTDGDDESAQPHVLSPPLMESLQAFFPYSLTGQNYYLKYSMVRDGSSLHSFLKRARGVQHGVLAIETLDGEVFGAFTGQAWRKNWNYFGSGESFLWRMRRSRLEKTHDILEQAQLESEIDVFPCTGENQLIQLCTHDRVALGGGTPSEKKTDDDVMVQDGAELQEHNWGFGLAISNDFMTGTSSPCVTFGSPSLSKVAKNGAIFEIANIELWALTPCFTVEQAEKLELGKLFLHRN